MLVGELSGALAHELNQPLTAILSNARAAQRLLAQGALEPAELQEILSDMAKGGQRAIDVIRRLRALLKKGEVQRQPLKVNEVVGDTLKLMRSDLARRRVTVETNLAKDLPAIAGDAVQLQQVLLNLLVNGCAAMAGVAGPERRLLVRTEGADGHGVRACVVDRGSGIAPGQRERLFEPFFTTKDPGMGLGLAICRTLITAHGGGFGAANNADRGATFQFTLPPKRRRLTPGRKGVLPWRKTGPRVHPLGPQAAICIRGRPGACKSKVQYQGRGGSASVRGKP